MLLDGHHRREACRRAKKPETVPVEWFSGSLDAAIAEAGARNCQDKLAMSTTQRMNFAWRLVKLGTLSKAEMRKAAAVGDGQIAIMRRVLRTLQADDPEAVESYRTWLKAKAAAEGKKGWTGMTETEIKDRMIEQAREWTKRMGKAVGTAFANNPEIAAMALEDLLGRKLPDVMRFLKDHVSKDDLEEEADGDDFDSDF